MADKKNVEVDKGELMIAQAKDFWGKYQKPIMIVCGAIILLGGGWLGYKNFIKAPKEKKAFNAMFKAEEYFRLDSFRRALNGDGANPGFLKIISQHSGTKAANLAHYYAGICYQKMDDDANAIKQLKQFSTDSKPGMQNTSMYLADSYGATGKFQDAFDNYKKAGYAFEQDEAISAYCLYYAAYTAAKKLNKSKEAIELLKDLKTKYPRSTEVGQADQLLAELGVYSSEN